MTDWEDCKRDDFFTLNLTANDNCKPYEEYVYLPYLQYSHLWKVVFGHTYTRRNVYSCHFRSYLKSKKVTFTVLGIFSHLFSVKLTILEGGNVQKNQIIWKLIITFPSVWIYPWTNPIIFLRTKLLAVPNHEQIYAIVL